MNYVHYSTYRTEKEVFFVAKRKKHPRLPSGWGSIRYLGAGRRNPYAVHPPATECYESGHYITPPAICYVPDWYVGFAVLNAWRSGTYKPGDEVGLAGTTVADPAALDAIVERILKDAAIRDQQPGQHKKTFAEVYQDFYTWKYGEHAPRQLSESAKTTTRSAFRNLSALHKMPFADIRLDDMQRILDQSPLGESAVKQMISLLKQVYKYGDARELCAKDYTRHLVMPQKKENEHGIPFTDQDLVLLWKDQDNPVTEMILIMCYSGFRVSAYDTIDTNLAEWYFQGGIKNKSSKGRIVPIHSLIKHLVERRLSRAGTVSAGRIDTFNQRMTKRLSVLGIERHTPHDCRHTFSALCEKYGVNERDRKRMLGHSFGNDVTNAVYGHRTVEELRVEIEKIKAPICDDL